MTEIRRRAEIRIGELSRELEKAQRIGPAGGYRLPDGRKSKADALLDAGISTSTAHEYEQLTGGADARGEAAAKRAIEETLARGRADRSPVSAKELRTAIKEAIVAELGPAPERRQSQAAPPRNPAGTACITFTSAIKTIAENETDLDEMASHFRVSNHDFLREAVTALPLLRAWIATLEEVEHETERSAA